MPLRATSHSKSWFARFNRSVARCQEVALIPNCLVNIGQTVFQFIRFIDLSRKTGILLQFVRSTISGHVTTNPSTLDDGPTAVSLQQQAWKFTTQPRLNCTSIRKPISPTSVLDPSRGHQKHQDGAPGYGSSELFIKTINKISNKCGCS